MSIDTLAYRRDRPSLELEHFLPYRLNVLAARVSQALARLYSERFGLDIAQWRVLATLGQAGEATATAIGAHAEMHKTKVSRAVGGLLKRGLLNRRVSDGDRREAVLSLSPAGRTTYEAIVPLARDYAEALSAALPPDDRAVFDRALTTLTDRAGALATPSGRSEPDLSGRR